MTVNLEFSGTLGSTILLSVSGVFSIVTKYLILYYNRLIGR